MGMYQEKLERKQVLLGHLMEIGTELFAMAATCSYAIHIAGHRHDEGAMDLADYFCREATRRIEEHFRSLSTGSERLMNDLGKKALNGDFAWMEDGIVTVD